MDENDAGLKPNNKPELVDEAFADERVKISMILVLLTEKLQARVEHLLADSGSAQIDDAELTKTLDHLERVIFLGQMNRIKAKDLQKLAPKKYQRILSDDELKKELRPVRDTENFPRRGPRGKREDAAGETESG